MSSSQSIQILQTSQVQFTSGSFTLGVSASPSMTQNITFVFPPNTGPTGYILQTDGAGNASWTPSSATFAPVPNDDYYRGRTNEIIPINVLVGVAGNTGGTDTLGGSLSGPTNAITDVTIVTPVKYGTLTSGATLGGYTYQSFPRTTGIDRFYYTITDSAGVTSKNSAMCTISIESNPPMGPSGFTGPYFLYSSTASNDVIQYNDGITSTIFTASFPGYTGGSLTGVCALATNRDDNLIYYCAVGATATQSGFIYAYDYINNFEFKLLDARATGFTQAANINFNRAGAVYNQKYLYIPQIGTGGTSFYEVNLSPYTYIGGAGTQGLIFTTQVNFTNSILLPQVCYDETSAKLVFCGNDSVTPTSNRITVVNPSTGTQLRTNTIASQPNRKIVIGPDNVFYTVAAGAATVKALNVYAGLTSGTYTDISTTSVASLGQYLSQPMS